MNKYLIIIVGLMLSACSSLPEPDSEIKGLSFIDFDGQPAAVFENRNEQKIVFGNMQSGDIKVFSQGQWSPGPPSFKEPFQPAPSFDNKLIVPMLSGNGFIFEPPSTPQAPEPDFFLVLELDKNPCLPNDGCGGDFGQTLRQVMDAGEVFICPDSNISRIFSSNTSCDSICDADCQSQHFLIRR